MTTEHRVRKHNEIPHIFIEVLFSGMQVMNSPTDVKKSVDVS
jgi:hypothetical protein